MEKANMRLATKVCLALAVVAAILWIAVEIMQAAGYVEANRLRWASAVGSRNCVRGHRHVVIINGQERALKMHVIAS